MFLLHHLSQVFCQRVKEDSPHPVQPVCGQGAQPGATTVSQVSWCQHPLGQPGPVCLSRSCPDAFPFPPLQAQVSPTCCHLPSPAQGRISASDPPCPLHQPARCCLTVPSHTLTTTIPQQQWCISIGQKSQQLSSTLGWLKPHKTSH